jgi:Ca2+-binding RTX toxin-like protein
MDSSERTSNSTILSKGEISENPLKIIFNDEGKLSNVLDNHGLKAFNILTGNPLEMTRVFFDNVDLSSINPDLKSVQLNIGVDFANSTQFATPFSVNSLQQTWGLTGTDQNDTLSGSAGNDWIIGDMGADKMTGGTGADQFSFHNVEETGLTAKTRDIITDFKHSDGDKIDVSELLTDPVMHDFSFIGSKTFSKTDATGELRFDTKTHILYGSTDADNKAEFSIQLNGVKSLVADDFISM